MATPTLRGRPRSPGIRRPTVGPDDRYRALKQHRPTHVGGSESTRSCEGACRSSGAHREDRHAGLVEQDGCRFQVGGIIVRRCRIPGRPVRRARHYERGLHPGAGRVRHRSRRIAGLGFVHRQRIANAPGVVRRSNLPSHSTNCANAVVVPHSALELCCAAIRHGKVRRTYGTGSQRRHGRGNGQRGIHRQLGRATPARQGLPGARVRSRRQRPGTHGFPQGDARPRFRAAHRAFGRPRRRRVFQ